jgi:hypothetical protein
MKYSLRLIFIIFILGSCKKEEVLPSVSTCYPSMKLSRSRQVTDAPVLVRASGGLYLGFQLIASNGVPWSACNLPNEFKRDSLKIYVSGYSLTSPELELTNITPLPFEVVGARLR